MPTILVVEDEQSIRRFITVNLNARHYETLQAGTCEEGLRLIKIYAPNALILDLKLPDMSGWDMLSRIDDDPAIIKPPVIIMTAASTLAQPNEYPYAHIVEKLAKPVSVSDLLQAVASIFR